MTFAAEFPDFPAADYPALPPGFVDTSWRNDACPSMGCEQLMLSVFVDYSDVSRREIPEPGPRFTLYATDGDFSKLETLKESDDWNDILATIEAARTPVDIVTAIANGDCR